MCPACIASAATFAVGITSSGGAAALILAKFHRIAEFFNLSSDPKAFVSEIPVPKVKEKQS